MGKKKKPSRKRSYRAKVAKFRWAMKKLKLEQIESQRKSQILATSEIKDESFDMNIEENVKLETYSINQPCLDIKSESTDDLSLNTIGSSSDMIVFSSSLIDSSNYISEKIIKQETQQISDELYNNDSNDTNGFLLVEEDESFSSTSLSNNPESVIPAAEEEVSITCADCYPSVHFNSFKDFKVHIAQNHNSKQVLTETTKDMFATNHEVVVKPADLPTLSLEEVIREQTLNTNSDNIQLEVTYTCPFCQLTKITSQDLLNQHIEFFHGKKCDQVVNYKVKITTKNLNLEEDETNAINQEEVKELDAVGQKKTTRNKVFVCPICYKSDDLTTIAQVWDHINLVHFKDFTPEQVEAAIMENLSYLKDLREPNEVEAKRLLERRRFNNLQRLEKIDQLKRRLAYIETQQKLLENERTTIEKKLAKILEIEQ